MKLRASLELWRDEGKEQRQVAVLREDDENGGGALIAYNAYRTEAVTRLAEIASLAERVAELQAELNEVGNPANACGWCGAYVPPKDETAAVRDGERWHAGCLALAGYAREAAEKDDS